jgi:hypothetical protein
MLCVHYAKYYGEDVRCTHPRRRCLYVCHALACLYVHFNNRVMTVIVNFPINEPSRSTFDSRSKRQQAKRALKASVSFFALMVPPPHLPEQQLPYRAGRNPPLHTCTLLFLPPSCQQRRNQHFAAPMPCVKWGGGQLTCEQTRAAVV